MKKIVKRMSKNKKSPSLCSFGSLDYMILASTLAIALGEELDQNEISVLASFFAVFSDELALIAALQACESGEPDEDVFVPPVPAVATTSVDDNDLVSIRKSQIKKKKKIIKKKRRRF